MMNEWTADHKQSFLLFAIQNTVDIWRSNMFGSDNTMIYLSIPRKIKTEL